MSHDKYEKLKDKLMIMKDDFIENPSVGDYIDEIIEEVENECFI